MTKKDRMLVRGLVGLFAVSILWSGWLNFSPKAVVNTDGLDQIARSFAPGIGVMVIDGPISYSLNRRGLYSQSLDGMIEQLQAFQEDKSVRALILRVNSPGGTVGASQEFYAAIRSFKAESGKPVVVSVADVCASGAYWLALASDEIFVNPGSLVGSIGVIMQGMDFTDVKERYGIGTRTVKSGKYKDLLSSWREPEKDELVMVQRLIDDVHSQFKAVVAADRQLSQKQAARLSQGQIFTGEQAVANGLVDQLGGFDTAIAYTADLVGLESDPRLIYKSRPQVSKFFEQLGAMFSFRKPWALLQI